MEKVSLTVENVRISFLDAFRLEIERLAVHQFDRIGIVGKNGSGKSTLLQLMAGHIKPDQGQIKRHTRFSYFDQVSSPHMEHFDEETRRALSIQATSVTELSGGEQTKVKLAALLSTYNEGMLLDEPTTHMDEAGKNDFVQSLTYYYRNLVEKAYGFNRWMNRLSLMFCCSTHNKRIQCNYD